MATKRLTLHISGRVQGVGYRYSCARMAAMLQLSGTCRNNPDGTVTAVFEGEEQNLLLALEWCRQGPAFARVDHIESCWHEASGELRGFSIQH